MRRPRSPLLAVDLIIEHTLCERDGIILIDRKFPPYGIALPGGHAEEGKSLEEQACTEADEETGLSVVLATPEQPLRVYSRPDRDPRYHMVAAVYVARGTGTIIGRTDAKRAFHVPLDELPAVLARGTFAFEDHERAIRAYLETRQSYG